MTKIIYIKRLPRSFYAINLFGIVFATGTMNAEEINHERIHTAQERELGYIIFYIWYCIEWLILLLRFRNGMKAYYSIRFEKEAYRHQHELDYLARRRHYRYAQ